MDRPTVRTEQTVRWGATFVANLRPCHGWKMVVAGRYSGFDASMTTRTINLRSPER